MSCNTEKIQGKRHVSKQLLSGWNYLTIFMICLFAVSDIPKQNVIYIETEYRFSVQYL